MGFNKLIFFMLSLIKESSQNALERFYDKIGEDISISQQAFSLARQKVKWEAFEELLDFSADTYYQEAGKEIERFCGLRISAIDGSKQSLPNDPPLRKYFGTSGAGNISPTAQSSILLDILNDVIMDGRIEPMSTDERTIAQMHIKKLKEMESFEEWKELIIFDRGYPSFELVNELTESKIHFLMRVRKKFSIEIDELSLGDHHKIYLEQDKKQIPVRVIKFNLEGGEEETLITNLFDKRYEIKTFKALYFKRWPIETKYDQLKKKLEIENFSGRLVDNIRQDFYATLVITNLVSDLVYKAQEEVEINQQGKTNKYKYKINLNHAIGVIKDHLIMAVSEEDEIKRQKLFDEMIEMLQKRIIPIRPGRSLPRGIPRKARFHHNHKSNC